MGTRAGQSPQRRTPLPSDELIKIRCAMIALPLILLAAIPAFLALLDALREPQLPTVAATPTTVPAPTVAHFIPGIISPYPDIKNLQLAFLREGNVWLANISPDPDLHEEWLKKYMPDPWPVTRGWSTISFAWSPDGQRIAAFDGSHVRFVHVDPERVEPQFGYYHANLGLLGPRSATLPALMWTPDQRHVVLWNIQNPKAGASVGWFILTPDGSEEPQFIPGRVVKMLALSNGSLIGIVSGSCNQALCPQELLRYDPSEKGFTRLDLDKYRQQGGVGILSTAAGLMLQNAADVECGYYSDSPATLTLGARPSGLPEGKEMPHDFLLAPDGSSVLIARGVACNEQVSVEWMQDCWPGGGSEPYRMSIWDGHGDKNEAELLSVSGVFSDWSPDSRWVAFQSCLAATPSRDLATTDTAPPWIYVLDSDTVLPKRTNDEDGILPVSEGCFPSWRPMP